MKYNNLKLSFEEFKTDGYDFSTLLDCVLEQQSQAETDSSPGQAGNGSTMFLCSLYKQYRTLAKRLECSPMARETWVQSQIESYQRLKKWYLMPLCLTLSIIRYGSRVKWSNSGKGVVPSPTPWCGSYRKGSLRVTFDYCRQLYLLYISSPQF